MNLQFVIAGELTPFLTNIHTKDHEHREQGQGKKKCHLNSVYSSPSYIKPMKNHLRSS